MYTSIGKLGVEVYMYRYIVVEVSKPVQIYGHIYIYRNV